MIGILDLVEILFREQDVVVGHQVPGLCEIVIGRVFPKYQESISTERSIPVA